MIDGSPDEPYSPVTTVRRCQDFLNEPAAMAELGVLPGHWQEETPKKHPELAREGVGYK